MANIQLGRDILAVEALIEERNREHAAQQLQLLAERIGRRPEFKYLQAMFDATFQVRADRELLRELVALVAEQPDFTEAVALLAFVYDRVGDRNKAEVFAREALRSTNPRALARARRVLGMVPPATSAQAPTPAAGTEAAFEVGSVSEPFASAAPPRQPPVFAPSPRSTPPPDRERTRTRAMVPPDPGALTAARQDVFPRSEAVTVPGRRASAFPGPADAHSSQPDLPPVETINFQPVGGVAPPPSIPPSAIVNSDLVVDVPRDATPTTRESPTLPGFAQVTAHEAQPEQVRRTSPPAAFRNLTPQPGFNALGLQDPRSRTRPTMDPPDAPERRAEQFFEQSGPESRSRPSRSAMAIPPPVEVQRQWFKYARHHQVTTSSGDSTALTLIDLAERVMEGRTPLSTEPMPLDRRGLIQVELKLEQFRNNRGSVSPAERASTTSAAAFLLAVLMKEADARAVDTTAEDGACKAVLPSGASVRPLLIAASYARGRGPGLVESYDRAATAHMRTPRAAAVTVRHIPDPEARTAAAAPRTATRRAPLSVPRRDLDPGTLCLVDPAAPMAAAPALNLRQLADEFWSSAEGREVAGASRRVGTFTLADIDALERHATRAFSLVGLWPPGLPWPWSPTDEQQRQILIWGAVVGEVLNGVYTGRWESDPSDPNDQQLYRVVLAGTVVAWPMAKVFLRLARGVAHDLSIYVDVVGRIVGRQATRSLNA